MNNLTQNTAIAGGIALSGSHYSLLGIIAFLALVAVMATLRERALKSDELEQEHSVEQQWAEAQPRRTPDQSARAKVCILAGADPDLMDLLEPREERVAQRWTP